MSAESIKENAVRKVIQEFVVPDLQKLIGKADILEEKINSVKNELKADIAGLDKKIDSTKAELKADIARLDDKIGSVKNELKADIGRLDERMDSLDDKIDTIKNELKADIYRLDEKVDLMNKFNERLFNLIHPTEQK